MLERDSTQKNYNKKFIKKLQFFLLYILIAK